MSELIKKLFKKVNFPVIINSYNRPTYLKLIVEQFNKLDIKPIILDNNSSNKNLLSYYENSSGKNFFLIKLNQNFGHDVIFLNEIYSNLPNYFAYTDCDIKLNHKLPNNFLQILSELTNEYICFKAGFALDINIDNLKNLKNKFGNEIYSWEKQFWSKKLYHSYLEVYSAAIDTTFAVYNKSNDNICGNKKKFNSIRVAGNFTSIHLPWMINDPMPDGELNEYLINDKNKLSTWGHK